MLFFFVFYDSELFELKRDYEALSSEVSDVMFTKCKFSVIILSIFNN